MKQQPVAVNDGSASTSLAETIGVLFITVFFNKKPLIYNYSFNCCYFLPTPCTSLTFLEI